MSCDAHSTREECVSHPEDCRINMDRLYNGVSNHPHACAHGCMICEMRGELTEARATIARLEGERDALSHAVDNVAPYVDCICGGCPRKVPQAWVSGMCEPCGAEDCEHTDGAKAVAQELREMVALANELESALVKHRYELDRYRAALEETPENVQAIVVGVHAIRRASWMDSRWAAVILAAIRAQVAAPQQTCPTAVVTSVAAGRTTTPPRGGQEDGTIPSTTVPRSHCGRCDRCGWPLAGVDVHGQGCWITNCARRPMPELRTHCAGCGAPFETEGDTK